MQKNAENAEKLLAGCPPIAYLLVQHQAFLSLWYRRYRHDGTEALVLYRRDAQGGRFGTVSLCGSMERL
jgi:hypothetical protein